MRQATFGTDRSATGSTQSTAVSFQKLLVSAVKPVSAVRLRQGRCVRRNDQVTDQFEVKHNRHMNLVELSALLAGRLYPPGNIPGTHFC
jgi:hypothetical protein